MSIAVRTLWIFVLVMLSTSGSAAPTPAPRLEYSPAPGTEIKTIAIIAPPDPSYFDVKRFDEAKAAFSGLYGHYKANVEQENIQKVIAALRDSGEKFRAGLAQRIAAQVAAAGYTTTIESGQWVSADGTLKLELAKVESTADAVILVTPTTLGFINPGGVLSDFLPTVLAKVEMVGPDRSRIIYRGFHAAGWIPAIPGVVRLQPVKGWIGTPAAKVYPKIDAVLADIPGAIQQLYAAEDAIAKGVAVDLHK